MPGLINVAGRERWTLETGQELKPGKWNLLA